MKDPLSKIHHGDVVGSPPKAEDENLHLLLQLVQPVRQRGGRRLVDYPHHLQPGYLPRVLGGLPLIVVEVGRGGYHCLLYREAEEVLRVLLDLLKDEGADQLRRVLFTEGVDLVVCPHLPLYLEDRAFWVGNDLPLGRFAHEELPLLSEGDHRREHLPRSRRPLRAGDYDGPPCLQDSCGGVRRTEVYTNYLLSACC